MNLSQRLLALARRVPNGAALADVGTDHAFLPIYLVQHDLVRRVIATDRLPGPLSAAARELARRGLTGRVELRLGEGLAPLHPGEVEAAVIAGMGGLTLLQVLESSPAVLRELPLLLLQPMGGAAPVRRWLQENRWRVLDEDLVLEDGHYYEIVAAGPGEQKLSPAGELAGPCLLRQRHPLLREYLSRQLAYRQRAAGGLHAARDRADQDRLPSLEESIRILEEVLQWLPAAPK